MKKAHKLLAVILSVIMILPIFSIVPFQVFAETDGTFTYSVSNGESTIIGLVDRNTVGAIEIPSTIGGYPVTVIDRWAFFGCSGLTSITIPDSVTSIGYGAFYGCRGLTSITITDSVTSIGDSTFRGCTGLTSITIPDSVTSIGDYAFYDCTGLTSITIPDSVTSIGSRAFYDTAWYINQPDGLVYAGKVAYEYKGICPASIDIMDGTLGIADDAFSGCKGLTSVTIPDSVTSIGYSAFKYCTGLTSITIPDSVTSIGDSAFSGCTGLTSITIPDSVTSIGSGAFSGCEGLTSITIPDSVTLIGGYAFFDCENLTDVYYTGTEQKKAGISIGLYNSSILNAAWHYYSTVNSKNVTCTEPGYTGDIGWLEDGIIISHSKEIPALGHDYKSVVTPPTCTEQGYTTYTCTRCDDSYIADYTDALGHSGGTATCKDKAKCTRCGAEYGELDPLNHQGVTILFGDIEPSYTKEGYTGDTYCLDCGAKIIIGQAIPVLVGEFKITYNLGGGKNNSGNPATFKTNAEVTLKNPTRSGYTFKGWYSDSGYKTKVTKIAKGTAKNITLYAKWEKAYTVTYKLNSGTNNSANPKTFTATTAIITLKNPTRKGYTFKGWYSDAKFKTKVTKITKGTKKNITLYAKWAINTYKITYKLNSGKNNAKNPKSYKVTTATITLKNPTRKGYTFKGWYSDSKYKTKVTKIAKGSTGNKTLYAKWAKK